MNRSLVLFAIRFVAIYGILLAVASLVNEPARSYLEAFGEWTYGGIGDRAEIDFEPLSLANHPCSERIVIINRSLMNSAGSGPVRNLDLDSEDVVSRPAALLLALIMATPISRKRKLSAAFWSLFWEHGIIYLVVGFYIWSESAEISLTTIGPLLKSIVLVLRQMLVAQLGFGIPVLLWVLVVFRRGDERLLLDVGREETA